MSDFEHRDYRIFDLFNEQWALVTAGNLERFNSCTVSWGSLGTLWSRPGKNGSIVTIYLHPTRYTRELMAENDLFTVAFFPEEYKKALTVMGTLSGRDGDKVAAAGLTPIAVGETVGYEEASLTFVCKKLYQHPMAREEVAEEIREYYIANPEAYPYDENGDWQPHWIFIGEIEEAIEKR